MESDSQKTSHDISIALIQKDVEYIKQSIVSINTQIQIMDKHYARHEDLSAIVKLQEDFKKNLDTKLDKDDFDPIKKTLARINWLVISAIVIALIGLVIAPHINL